MEASKLNQWNTTEESVYVKLNHCDETGMGVRGSWQTLQTLAARVEKKSSWTTEVPNKDIM